MTPDPGFVLRLREALATSWDIRTAHNAVQTVGNPALGQCYPTSRVVQHYFPETKIIKGEVWTGRSEEVHFWNGFPLDGDWQHMDLTWQQFPAGSVIRTFVALNRQEMFDSKSTVQRCALLLKRVQDRLRNLS